MAFLPLILILVLMWALMIRPQQKRAREHQAVVTSLRVGDEVMTSSGLFGTVTSLGDDVVSVEMAPGVVVRVLKAAIVRNLAEHEDEELEGTYDDYEDTGHADHEDTDHPDPEERAD